MGHMGGIKPGNNVLAQGQLFAVGQHFRGSVGKVANTGHGADLATQQFGFWCSAQKLVHSAALVCFEVAKGNVAQFIERYHGVNSLGHRVIQSTRTGMEQ